MFYFKSKFKHQGKMFFSKSGQTSGSYSSIQVFLFKSSYSSLFIQRPSYLSDSKSELKILVLTTSHKQVINWGRGLCGPPTQGVLPMSFGGGIPPLITLELGFKGSI